MNQFAAKTRKQIDRDKYLKNIDAIKARCNVYYWAHPEYNPIIQQIARERKAK